MGQLTHSVEYINSGSKIDIKIEQHSLRDLLPGELLVKVTAVGLNRADILQREGVYIPPDDETKVPGVEISGEIFAVNSELFANRIGERVCGVVRGGGFSEYCILEEGMAMPVPHEWTDIEAAAFPEAALTAYEALSGLAKLHDGNTVLLHAASSGMGTMLLTMAKKMGLKVICTTTSPKKKKALLELGADEVIVLQEPDFTINVMTLTHGKGVDAVIDFLAGRYANENITAVAQGGCVVVAGIMDGSSSNLNWVPLINRRIRILPLSLRMKSSADKHDVNLRFLDDWWDKGKYKTYKPIIGLTRPLRDLDVTQSEMKKNRHVGKIVIDCTEGWQLD